MLPWKNIQLVFRQYIRNHVIFGTLLLIYVLWEMELFDNITVDSSRTNRELATSLQTELEVRNIIGNQSNKTVKTSEETNKIAMSSKRKPTRRPHLNMSDDSPGRHCNTTNVTGLQIPSEVTYIPAHESQLFYTL